LIRRAELADLRNMAHLAQEFYAASHILRTFDLDRFVTMWTHWLTSGMGEIFLLDEGGQIQGTIGGVIHQETYSSDLIAAEFFWYVEDKHRGQGIRLFRAFEDWAKQSGASEIRMGHLVDSMPEKVGAFYERVGYRKVETLYAKRLDAPAMGRTA
jgi:GNAT superfamily N-acetyltransferase